MRFLTRAAIATVTLCAALFFALILVQSAWGGESYIVPPGDGGAAQHIATSSLPVRFMIPSLGINANVQYAGINGRGELAVPTNFTDVAWYENGTVPGQKGSAVVDGHVDNGLSLPGVFKHLSDIKLGDSVYVQTRNGSMLHFVVYDIETYPYTAVPLQTLFADVDSAHLNIITCEGAWVAGQNTYDHRVVVYTTLVT